MNENSQSTSTGGAHAKHGMPAHSRNSNGGGDSSIELLRIIAMFMILIHHFIVHNGYDVLKLPLGPERIFFQLAMAGGGKVGVVIFFSISAWFFLDREQTIKSNLKRVWIMERELLFWSLALMMFYLVFDRADLGTKLMVRSLVPLSTGIWWYATACAIFLMLLPFLSKGLKVLGREYHLALAATVLVIWGLTSFIPGMIGINDGFFGFIYLFILISAYKWYMEPFTTRQVWLMIGTGLGFFLLYTCASHNIVAARARHGNIHHRRLEAARHHGRLRHVPAVRPRHLPQSSHQPDNAIRVRRVPDHRLCRIRKTALDTTVQPARPLPAAIRDSADPRHTAHDLRDLYPD